MATNVICSGGITAKSITILAGINLPEIELLRKPMLKDKPLTHRDMWGINSKEKSRCFNTL
jgi:hypothetical protein